VAFVVVVVVVVVVIIIIVVIVAIMVMAHDGTSADGSSGSFAFQQPF
jgi:hypothetical protein